MSLSFPTSSIPSWDSSTSRPIPQCSSSLNVSAGSLQVSDTSFWDSVSVHLSILRSLLLFVVCVRWWQRILEEVLVYVEVFVD